MLMGKNIKVECVKMDKNNIELLASMELLQRPKVILDLLDKSNLNEEDSQKLQIQLSNMSDLEIEEVFKTILPNIAIAVSKINPNIKTIYNNLKTENSDVKKSIDFQTAMDIAEFVKTNLEIFASIISILSSLDYLENKNLNVKKG